MVRGSRLAFVLLLCAHLVFPSSLLAIGDPNIPDLVYDPFTGNVQIDWESSTILSYVLKNDTNSFFPSNHNTILLGSFPTSTSNELSEATSFIEPGVTIRDIGNVFPANLDLTSLENLLTVNSVARDFTSPLVPFDLYVDIIVEPNGPPIPSFDDVLELDTLDIDFGTVAAGSVVAPIDFEISNLENLNWFGTEFLDMTSIVGTGDTGVLSTDLAPFTDLGWGRSLSFDAMIDTSVPGVFSASYELSFPDSALHGPIDPLTLNITGNVVPVPEPSSYAMAALALVGICVAGWRRRTR